MDTERSVGGRRRVDGREKSKVVSLQWAWREELKRLRKYVGLRVEEAVASRRRVRLRVAGVVGMDVPRRTSTSCRYAEKKRNIALIVYVAPLAVTLIRGICTARV